MLSDITSDARSFRSVAAIVTLGLDFDQSDRGGVVVRPVVLGIVENGRGLQRCRFVVERDGVRNARAGIG